MSTATTEHNWPERAVIAMIQRYREDIVRVRPGSGMITPGTWDDGHDYGLKDGYEQIVARLVKALETKPFSIAEILTEAETWKRRRASLRAQAEHKLSGGWNGHRKGHHDAMKWAWEGALTELIAINAGEDPKLGFNLGRASHLDHRPPDAASVEWFYGRWEQERVDTHRDSV